MKGTSCLQVHGSTATLRQPSDQPNTAIHYPPTFFHPIRPEDLNANSLQGCAGRRRDEGWCAQDVFFYFFFIINNSYLSQAISASVEKKTCIIHNHNKTGQFARIHLTCITKETHVSSEMFPPPLHNTSPFNHRWEMCLCHITNM